MLQLQNGVSRSQLGGMSDAMAFRSAAALAYCTYEKDVVKATAVAMFTHRNPLAHQGAEFFARVAFRVIHHGLNPRTAIEDVARDPRTSSFVRDKVGQALANVEESVSGPLQHEEFADDLALTSMARLWEVGKTEPIKVGKASPTE